MKYYEAKYSFAESIDESLILYEDGGREQGSNIDETQKGRADSGVLKVAESRNAGEPSGEQTRRNSGQDDSNKQGKLKYSSIENIVEFNRFNKKIY